MVVPSSSPTATPRQRLLDRVVDFALHHAIAEVSLRQLAAAVGTSHRMLIHHFGSREALLVEVIRTVEAQQQAVLDAELAADASAADAARRYWLRLRQPELAAQERLFFEVYGQALRGQTWATPMLDGVVNDWIDAFAPAADGPDERSRRAAVRLGLAVTRGLLLDLLATGDTEGVDDAMELYLQMLGPKG